MSLPKEAFVTRVFLYATRHGQVFKETLLNEWIKQGLIPKGDRGPNNKRRPTFTFGHEHHRRALRLLRLRSLGFRDRDATLVQLFIRGHSVSPTEVCEEMIKEGKRARAQINTSIRSVHADRAGPITQSRRSTLLDQVGEQDRVFSDAGLTIDPDLLISIVRAARSPRLTIRNANSNEAQITETLSGMLDLTVVSTVDDTDIDHIVRSSQDLFLPAREIMNVARHLLTLSSMPNMETRQRRAWLTAGEALLQREFAVMTFIAIVTILRENQNYR